MEVEKKKNIQWSKLALKNLKKVHTFYIKTANNEVADKVVDELFSNIKTLEHSSFIGQLESTLKNLKKEHRYLVLQHCKIIYRVESDIIYITHVFDTRQNPLKLK
jgi:plasmid stabilization system protein ParE